MKLNEINDDCLMNVLSFLSFNQRVAILRVCQRWRLLILGQFARERSLLITYQANPFHLAPSYAGHFPDKPDVFHAFPLAYQPGPSVPLNFAKSPAADDHSSLVLSPDMSPVQFDCLILWFRNLTAVTVQIKKSGQTLSASVLLKFVLERCKRLTKLNLTDCKEINSECLRAIAECQTLEHLDLANCKIGNNGLKLILKQCVNLESLHIGNNRRLTGQFFRCCVAKIRSLDLSNIVFSVKGLDALANSLGGSLESLISPPISTSDSLRFFCTKFPKLLRLKLSLANEINLEILAGALLPDLRSLSLHGHLQLNDDNFSRLMANFGQVVEFELCPIQAISIYLSVLDLPKRWPNIARLSLSNLVLACEKNRSLLRAFLTFTALESLSFGLANLEETDFTYFLSQLIEKQPKLQYLNAEYLLPDQKCPSSNMHDLLKFVPSAGFLLHINRARMNRHSPYIFLMKITIQKSL